MKNLCSLESMLLLRIAQIAIVKDPRFAQTRSVSDAIKSVDRSHAFYFEVKAIDLCHATSWFASC